MATPTIPSLTDSQREVLATLPPPRGTYKRTYEKLLKLGLVSDDCRSRTDDGDEVLSLLRAEGLIPEAEESVSTVAEPAPEDSPAGASEAPEAAGESLAEPAPEPARRSVPGTPVRVLVYGREGDSPPWNADAVGAVIPDVLVREFDVYSREDVVDAIFPPDEYDREINQDLRDYLGEITFGPSLDGLPETSEGGEDVEYTDELIAQAVALYAEKNSYRAVGKELGVHPQTAKNLVDAGKKAAAAAKPARRSGGGGGSRNVNVVDPDAMRTCRYPDHEGPNPIPATEENFAVRKSGARAGSFVGWCRKCNSKYGEKARATKNGAKAETEIAGQEKVA